jgi:uncharacterized protein YeaO (DUF488 family)
MVEMSILNKTTPDLLADYIASQKHFADFEKKFKEETDEGRSKILLALLVKEYERALSESLP